MKPRIVTDSPTALNRRAAEGLFAGLTRTAALRAGWHPKLTSSVSPTMMVVSQSGDLDEVRVCEEGAGTWRRRVGCIAGFVPVSEPATWQTEDETGEGAHCRRGQEDHEHHQPHSRPVAGESEDHAEHDHDEDQNPETMRTPVWVTVPGRASHVASQAGCHHGEIPFCTPFGVRLWRRHRCPQPDFRVLNTPPERVVRFQ